MPLTIPIRIPSMNAPAKRRQKPARGPEAPPLGGGVPAACGGGGYMAKEVLLSDQREPAARAYSAGRLETASLRQSQALEEALVAAPGDRPADLRSQAARELGGDLH